MSKHDPFFIVGSGRSGTTLLRLLLNGHSKIHIPPETWFLTSLLEEIPTDRVLTSAQVDRALNLITQNYRWPDMQMEAIALAERAKAVDQPTLGRIVDLIYDAQLVRANKVRFGDKTPPYIHIVPQLLALYHGAKFIHLVRDGRDVAISFVDAGFHDPGCRCYDGGAFEWTSAIRKAAAYSECDFADRILMVRYEDLVSDPEACLRAICTFLGESFEPQMLNWQKQAEGVPSRERHIHKKLSQPISDSNVEGWRLRLSAMQCFVMESCLQTELRALGYSLRFNKPVWRPLMVTTSCTLKILAPILVRMSFYLRKFGLVSKNAFIL